MARFSPSLIYYLLVHYLLSVRNFITKRETKITMIRETMMIYIRERERERERQIVIKHIY